MGKGDAPVLHSATSQNGASKWIVYGALLLGIFWLIFGPSGSSTGPRAADDIWSDWSAVQEIFAFGDSWTTTDFNIDGTQPNEQNPMGNPEFPNDPTKKYLPHRAVDRGASVKADLSLGPQIGSSYNASFIKTYNLARGAATIDRAVIPPLFQFTQTLFEQVRDIYKSRYASPQHHSGIWPPKHRLVIVFFGVVDLALLSRDVAADINIIDDLLKSYQASLDELYDSEVRHILVMTAPPMDMAPTPDNLALLAALIPRFNAGLRDAVARFRARHADAAIRTLDVHGLLARLARDPAALPQTAGIRNATRACFEYDPDLYAGSPQAWAHADPRCGIPRDQYFWANGLHVTHPVQEAMAAMLVAECFGPANRATGRRGWGLCD